MNIQTPHLDIEMAYLNDLNSKWTSKSLIWIFKRHIWRSKCHIWITKNQLHYLNASLAYPNASFEYWTRVQKFCLSALKIQNLPAAITWIISDFRTVYVIEKNYLPGFPQTESQMPNRAHENCQMADTFSVIVFETVKTVFKIKRSDSQRDLACHPLGKSRWEPDKQKNNNRFNGLYSKLEIQLFISPNTFIKLWILNIKTTLGIKLKKILKNSNSSVSSLWNSV